MKPFLLACFFISLTVAISLADPFADPAIKQIQDQHEKGVAGDKQAVISLIADLEQQTKAQPENKLKLAYLGSAYTLRSRDLFPGPSKWKYLQLGIKTMDDAVSAAPDDLAVRFIRAVNNFQLPGIFNRREIARSDFQTLLTQVNIPSVAQTLNTDTMQAIYFYAGLAYKEHAEAAMARSTWNDGIKLAPSSPLGEKIASELNKLKS
jgi:hypothetical protein